MALGEIELARAMEILRSRNLVELEPLEIRVACLWATCQSEHGKNVNPSAAIYRSIFNEEPPPTLGNPKNAAELCLEIRKIAGMRSFTISELKAVTVFSDILEDLDKGKEVKIGKTGCLGLFTIFGILSLIAGAITHYRLA